MQINGRMDSDVGKMELIMMFRMGIGGNGNANDSMGMAKNRNSESHSRTPHVETQPNSQGAREATTVFTQSPPQPVPLRSIVPASQLSPCRQFINK